jgi:hypothetical protein
MQCSSRFILKGSIQGLPRRSAGGSSVKTVANMIVVPMRMAPTVTARKEPSGGVVKPDQFTSALHVRVASAAGTGRIQQRVSAGPRSPLKGLKRVCWLAHERRSVNGPFRTLLVVAVAISMTFSPRTLGRIRPSVSCNVPMPCCNENCPASEATTRPRSNCCSLVPVVPRAYASSTQNSFGPDLSGHSEVVPYYSALLQEPSYKPVLRLLTDPPPLRLRCSLQL